MTYLLRPMLAALGACGKSLEWLDSTPHLTLEEAWSACPRVDWLYWLARKALGLRQFALVNDALALTQEADTLAIVAAGYNRSAPERIAAQAVLRDAVRAAMSMADVEAGLVAGCREWAPDALVVAS